MKIGDKVKVITKDRASYGDTGTIVGTEMTVFGLMFKVEFPDRVTKGLYSEKDLRLVIEEGYTEDEINLYSSDAWRGLDDND